MGKKSKKKRASSIHIITLLFVAVCIAYLFRYFAYKVEVEMVKYDSMENTIVTQGVLIKNEWSMTLPVGTVADYKANEGDRVSIGKQILKISKNDGADENISRKIDKINERIEEIKKAEVDNGFFAADKKKMDANIQDNVNELKMVAKSGDFSKLEEVKSDLAANVYKRSLVAGTDSFSGQNIEQLLSEKASLEEIQKNNLNVIYARTSGLVSYELDGFEAVLKPESIAALKVSSILEIINAASEKSSKKAEVKVEGVKIVDNFEWYIASIIPKGILTKDDIGKSILVRFKDANNTVVSGTLKHFNEGNESGNLIVVRTDEQLKNFQRIRTSEVEIITKHDEGLIVPVKCIVEKEGIQGVYIERSGMVRFAPIKISISDEKEALVKILDTDDKGFSSKSYLLKPFDKVITTPNKVKEDQMLPGAF